MAKSYASTVINAPADAVWAHIRDFNGLATWNSEHIITSQIEDGRTGDQVGAIRAINLGDGTLIREQLRTHSDLERSYTYAFQTQPFPIDNYLCTLRVTPITDGDASFVEWWTVFDCSRDEHAQWTGFFAEVVFQPGFEAIKRHFGQE